MSEGFGPLITARELAAYLRVTDKTLIAWRKKNVGPRAIIIGHVIRYRLADVEAYVKDNFTPRTVHRGDS